MDPLATLTTVIELWEKVSTASRATKNAELDLAIAELKNALGDLKCDIAGLKEENAQLRITLASAQVRTSEQDRLTRENGVLWLRDPPPGEFAGPFCPTCHADNGRLIPLQALATVFATTVGKWRCGVCKSHYE
jgi:hypothetical protein